MANRLHQVLTFTNVPAAGQAALPHNINVNDVALLPDLLFLDNGDFSVVSCTTTTLTVQNNGIGVDSLDAWLFRLHTFDRAFGPASTVNLSPQPFIMVAGGSSGGGGTGNAQAFRYTATGAEGSDFFVNLPAARPTDVYRVEITCAGVTSIVDFDAVDLIAGDRTTTQFRLVTSASLTAGDQFDIIVFDQLP